jgi:hypothetical protein
VTLAGSKLDCFKNSIIVKNLKTCIVVLLYSSYIMANAQSHNVINGLDTYKLKQGSNSCRIKVTSANNVGQGRKVNSDP